MIRTTVGTLRGAVRRMLGEAIDIRQQSPDSPLGQMYGSSHDDDDIANWQYDGVEMPKADWDDQIDDIVTKIVNQFGEEYIDLPQEALSSLADRAAKWAGFDEEYESEAAGDIEAGLVAHQQMTKMRYNDEATYQVGLKDPSKRQVTSLQTMEPFVPDHRRQYR